MDPSYTPPADFKPPKKYRKVFVPVSKDVYINYVGQIIGPGGATQKRLEKETKCKIQLRGEGAEKVQKDYMKEMLDGPTAVVEKEEPLHVHLTADNEQQLDHAEQMIQGIIQQTEDAKKYAIIAYDGSGMRRVYCENCGQKGHKFHECPHKIMGAKSKISCKHCQSQHHVSSDCPQKKGHLFKALTSDPKSFALTEAENRANAIMDADEEL